LTRVAALTGIVNDPRMTAFKDLTTTLETLRLMRFSPRAGDPTPKSIITSNAVFHQYLRAPTPQEAATTDVIDMTLAVGHGGSPVQPAWDIKI